MAESKSESYAGSPEDLNMKHITTDKIAVDAFINPGTPDTPLVNMNDRKTGVVAGGASDILRARLQPSASDSDSVGPVSNNGGVLPVGKSA